MFQDGFIDIIDVYMPVKRTSLIDDGEPYFEEEPKYKNILCRINNEKTKIMLDTEIEFEKGCKLINFKTNDEYFVKEVFYRHGTTQHHTTVKVEKRGY